MDEVKRKLLSEQTDNQQVIEALNSKIKSLENDLVSALKNEHEKDLEISQLQKGL